jgi:hypothetical protein
MAWSSVRLIGSWSLAHFGYRAALIAMPLLALQQTGSAWTVGLVSGAGGLPAVTAPWWTPRLQRRLRSAAALAGLMAAEGLATLLVPSSAAMDALTPAVMVAAGLVIGGLNAVSGPLNASLLAALGDRADDRRTPPSDAGPRSGAARLLALQDTAVKVSMTIAPLATLPLVTVLGATWTVALEGILSLVAAGLVATLRLTSHADDGSPQPLVRAMLRGHRDIAMGWTVRGVGCAAWFAFTLGLVLLGEAHGSGLLLATVGLTSYSAGAVVGSGLGVLTASSRRPALVNSLSWLVAGAGWLAMGLEPAAVVIGAAAVVMGLAVPAGNAATMAMVTRSFSGLERRAALTAQATVVTGSSTTGMLLGGPLIAVVGPQAAIVLAGLAVTGAAATAAATEYIRGRRYTRTKPTNRTAAVVPAGRMRHDRGVRRQRELPRLQHR